MTIESILHRYHKCKKYILNDDVSDYMHYIDKKPFYVSPSFHDIRTHSEISTLKPKFILFSAPGAAGKSSLAKFIANKYDAIYWNLTKVKIGTNSFAGCILKAVGAAKYSNFIEKLNSGDVLLVIDAFDEAEIVSGRKMLGNFIDEISANLTNVKYPTVFLLARTETAQYIASFCSENSISLLHYEIGFFEENTAKLFIKESIVEEGKQLKQSDIDCVNEYYSAVKNNISPAESKTFLGYAPVLEAISKHIKTSPNRKKMINELSLKKDCTSVIIKIMGDLLEREQNDKVVPAFAEKCRENYPEFNDWNKIYSEEEQLIRIIYYVLFQDTTYENYELDFLPPQLVEDYNSILKSFLPQHPFIRNSINLDISANKFDFTGPAFRDFTLAKIVQKEKHSTLVDMYFEESQSLSYFPSQIFFDCYITLSGNRINSEHISYVYDSFKAKATALEQPFLECTEVSGLAKENNNYNVIFGMLNNTNTKGNIYTEIFCENSSITFEQLTNVFIDASNLYVKIGKPGFDTRIFNSSIICKNIEWVSKNITIESYYPNGCLLAAHDGFIGNPVNIDIVKSENLKISAPNIKDYYKFLQYKYDIQDESNLDITKFVHALRCILVEFRTHKKDTLAKTAERIENVTVGSSKLKRKVLDFLKRTGIIYTSGHLYKVNEEKMQSKGINFNSLYRTDSEQLGDTFNDFSIFLNSNQTD